jgi:hypothetical protein
VNAELRTVDGDRSRNVVDVDDRMVGRHLSFVQGHAAGSTEPGVAIVDVATFEAFGGADDRPPQSSIRL